MYKILITYRIGLFIDAKIILFLLFTLLKTNKILNFLTKVTIFDG